MSHVHCKTCGVSVDWLKGTLKPEYCTACKPYELEINSDSISLLIGALLGIIITLMAVYL